MWHYKFPLEAIGTWRAEHDARSVVRMKKDTYSGELQSDLVIAANRPTTPSKQVNTICQKLVRGVPAWSVTALLNYPFADMW